MEPQRLAAIHGWQWIKKGYALFVQSPLLWIVLLSICFVTAALVSVVPMVGEPLVSLLMPIIVIGLMTGCYSLERGDELGLGHLFSGFLHQTSHLITLGGIALVGQYLIFGVMKMTGGAEIVSLMMSNQPPPSDPEVIRQAVTGAESAILLGALLFSALLMSMQYAPMLVFFRNVEPIAAMKLSMRAFTHNIGPMLLYGTSFFLLAMLASIPMMLGWLVLMPIMFTSLYVSFGDIFPAEKVADVASEEGPSSDTDDQPSL